MKKLLLLVCMVGFRFLVIAQEEATYKTPPKEIMDLVMARPTPMVSFNAKADYMILIQRASMPPVEELAQPEYRIAGLRMNPANFGGSRQTYFNGLQIKEVTTGQTKTITGLPADLRGTSMQWSPSQQRFAFLQYNNGGIDLYTVDLIQATAQKVNQHPLNDVLGTSFIWQNDSTVIYKAAVNAGKKEPARPAAPSGPVIQESLGKAAASRTYQDLIKSPYDEMLFEHFAKGQLYRLQLVSGKEEKLGEEAIYRSFSISPNKEFLLTAILEKPFSYLVPWSGFPTTYKVSNLKGELVKTIASNPSSEGAPIGFDDVVSYPRGINWRDDQPATIYYVQALDNGKGRAKSEFRDGVYCIDLMKEKEPRLFTKTTKRFRGIEWGNDQVALLYEGMNADRSYRINLLNPMTGKLDSLQERSSNDQYNDLGQPITTRNQYGRNVIQVLKNGSILLTSNGASEKGDLPLLRSMNLKTRVLKELWRCQEGYFEYVVRVLDAEKGVFITRRESPTETPNYYVRNLTKKIAPLALTQFTNPYEQLEGISKEKIKYKRADGIDLTATLYLPKGYDKTKDGPLPLLIWAYPREYKSAADAAQVRGSQYTFPTISYGSPIFWATQGYAVMDNAEMPIVGEGNKEPNDAFIPQLYLNAHAAIQAAAKMGVGDSTRVGVGGHSYGAFMTANLLAHTNLFKAGIARSGAYNRTLTPFGFQAEERTYWQAPEVYYNMSPFSFANKIKTPILLIHGEMDNNPGTFPIQSERLYNAIKGHGGVTRYISLPYESHGYAGKENILHMLWEQHQWLEKFVKQAKSSTGDGKKAF
ncbi:prolyl oligopeptidase family serine peptidase [Flavihumibacter sp. RY-1]|uniref:Prolyl oligopeptidase family serine peptidase n=1 Tax=Flavihumibacter fluminis TaxID=2909236 RepID=A0ABS9BDU9_9BACT|nr:prolyl oligopeptidase family serine peptidase [Flavihumibacter fluminis]MCF1713475.1 prolyl oligopeptidase family serine peptidase [Flavihumibacter fluminis]